MLLILKNEKMKKILIFTIVYLSLPYYGNAQQVVQNISHVYILKENEQQFINKPLKNLLKEIKPEIKLAFAYNDPSYFDFRFITSEQLKKGQGTAIENVALFIYVKDYIDWKWEERPKGKETIWTKEDAERYGNLIITKIGVVY